MQIVSLVVEHWNLKLWTGTGSLSPNASNCDEEQKFLLLLAVSLLIPLQRSLYSENSFSQYTELAGVAKNFLTSLMMETAWHGLYTNVVD